VKKLQLRPGKLQESSESSSRLSFASAVISRCTVLPHFSFVRFCGIGEGTIAMAARRGSKKRKTPDPNVYVDRDDGTVVVSDSGLSRTQSTESMAKRTRSHTCQQNQTPKGHRPPRKHTVKPGAVAKPLSSPPPVPAKKKQRAKRKKRPTLVPLAVQPKQTCEKKKKTSSRSKTSKSQKRKRRKKKAKAKKKAKKRKKQLKRGKFSDDDVLTPPAKATFCHSQADPMPCGGQSSHHLHSGERSNSLFG